MKKKYETSTSKNDSIGVVFRRLIFFHFNFFILFILQHLILAPDCRYPPERRRCHCLKRISTRAEKKAMNSCIVWVCLAGTLSGYRSSTDQIRWTAHWRIQQRIVKRDTAGIGMLSVVTEIMVTAYLGFGRIVALNLIAFFILKA